MYKLLKPTHIGINYMVERLQEHISHLGHEKIQSLQGENVCKISWIHRWNRYQPFRSGPVRSTFQTGRSGPAGLDR